MRVLPATPGGLAVAAAAIRAGEVVAYPTETVYGLGADPFNESALARLFEIKGRPETNPVLLIVSDAGEVGRVAAEVSEAARACMDAFWPGPLSLVLPAAAGLPAAVTAGGTKVCVRCPGSDVARALCRLAGGPVTSTSANRSGEPAASRLDDALLPGVVLVLDGGTLPSSLPSTVYDPDTGEVLRAGAVPEEALRALRRPAAP